MTYILYIYKAGFIAPSRRIGWSASRQDTERTAERSGPEVVVPVVDAGVVDQDGPRRIDGENKVSAGAVSTEPLSLSPRLSPLPHLPSHHVYRTLFSLMVMAFTSVYSASAYSPSSRPLPDIL